MHPPSPAELTILISRSTNTSSRFFRSIGNIVRIKSRAPYSCQEILYENIFKSRKAFPARRKPQVIGTILLSPQRTADEKRELILDPGPAMNLKLMASALRY